MAKTVQVHFHPAHLGSSSRDSGIDFALRVVAAGFGSYDGWSEPDKYGCDYENDVFLMRRDGDLECTCGWHERREAWWERNPHAPDCYSLALGQLFDAWDKANAEPKCRKMWKGDGLGSERTADGERWCAWHDLRTKEQKRIARALCKDRKINWRGGYGSHVHCDCGTDAAIKFWLETNRCADGCPWGPNFLYKPTGFRVRWYKYIGRDTRMNDSVNLREMLDAIFATHPAGRTVEEAVAIVERVSGKRRDAFSAVFASLNTESRPSLKEGSDQ